MNLGRSAQLVLIGIAAVVVIVVLLLITRSAPPASVPITITAPPVSTSTLPATSLPAATLSPTPLPSETPLVETTSEPVVEVTSAQTLIAAALESGQIDYGTSLLYRAYAIYGDDRLPEVYLGDGAETEDPGLYLEIAQAGETLPAAIRTQLRPFTVRPNHPDSIFNAQQPSSTSSIANVAFQTSTATPPPPCTTTWESVASDTYPVIVWGCKGSGEAAIELSNTLVVIESLWKPMTDLMCLTNPNPGHSCPLPDVNVSGDDGNTDDKIDIYLVNFTSVLRNGKDRYLTSTNLARALPSPPLLGNANSGYILLDRTRLGDAQKFRTDFIHEFFHVLQYAHNIQVFKYLPGCPTTADSFWFVEASATWAEWFFYQEQAAKLVHTPWFVEEFQKGEYALHGTSDTQEYAAYIWPYFMQQQLGSGAKDGSPIAKTWDELVVAKNCDEAFTILDTVLPFSTHFHTFALRNLNWDFQESNPITPLYNKLDTNFPTGVTTAPHTAQQPPVLLTPQATPRKYTDGLWSLQAGYYRFAVSPDVRQLKFDLTSLGGVDVDALIEVDGRWKLQSWSGKSSVRFCRDQPNQRVESVLLVISNHRRYSPNLFNANNVQFEVTANTQFCTCNEQILNTIGGWQGNISYSFSGMVERSGNRLSDQWNIERSASFDVKWDQNYMGSPVAWGGDPVGGNLTITDRWISRSSQSTATTTKKGASPPAISVATLADRLGFNVNNCTYYVYAGPILANHTETLLIVPVRGPSINRTENYGQYGVGHVNMKDILLPESGLTLSGSATIPILHGCNITECGNHLWVDVVGLFGNVRLGEATVTWSFSPITPPTDTP